MEDNQGQNLKKDKEIAAQRPSEKIANPGPILFFKKDKHFSFVSQKTEKLVGALYLITNFFPDAEPAKWQVRSLGGKLLKLSIDLYGGIRSELLENKFKETSLEVCSLLQAASLAGLISEMNLSIIKREFNNLIAYINRTPEEKIRLNSTINSFLVDHNEIFNVEKIEEIKPKIKDNFPEPENNVQEHSAPNDLKGFSSVAVKKNKRQSIIIALAKRKKDFMVKDVSAIIRDCSEKTLQRELTELVRSGVLKKDGERRWTKYNLVF